MNVIEFNARFGAGRLDPGCWLAAAYAEQELRGEAMSIEFLRAAAESVPTYPEAWTRAEGADFAAAFNAA